ncbi:MAG: hypothetical protein MUC41_04130 [Syntrophobacteraceae bacterium]|jgi:hypothetical protein|nr:hypothetical protein [Syntrophobacteraceae bacterium]
MTPDPSLEDLARVLRGLYRSNPGEAPVAIEAYLRSSLKDLEPDQRSRTVRRLQEVFTPRIEAGTTECSEPPGRLAELVWGILGQEAPGTAQSQSESIEALADALNSVFDHLNELVALIHGNLLGRSMELETIRQVIRSDIAGGGESESIRAYLDHIREAFLIASRAYTLTVRKVIEKILHELDPDRLSQSTEQGLKFGFMRKGESFELYQEKFSQFKRWYESDRFSEDFTREFERTCQRLYSERGGAS